MKRAVGFVVGGIAAGQDRPRGGSR
jgi:hypothetical protein